MSSIYPQLRYITPPHAPPTPTPCACCCCCWSLRAGLLLLLVPPAPPLLLLLPPGAGTELGMVPAQALSRSTALRISLTSDWRADSTVCGVDVDVSYLYQSCW